MAENGFIQVPNEVFKDLERQPEKLAAFCWLVANRDFETGELRHGIRAVSNRFEKSHNWARAIIEYTASKMAQKWHKNGTDRAQKWHGQSSQALGDPPRDGTAMAQKGHGNGTQMAALQEEEQEEDIKRTTKTNVPSRAPLLYPDDFTDWFWTEYPGTHRNGKGAALTAWKKIRPPRPTREHLKETLAWQAQTEQWRKGFIPNPATYLNQRRWEDEKPVEPDGAGLEDVKSSQEPWQYVCQCGKRLTGGKWCDQCWETTGRLENETHAG